MKTKLFLLANALFIVVLLSSCGGGGHKKKIAKIDSLLTAVDKSTELLNSVNFDTMTHINNVYKQANLEISRVTLVRPTAEQMLLFEVFGQCKKPFRLYLESKENFIKELDYTKLQLESLKESIGKNEIPKDSIDTYILMEEAAAIDITMEVNDVVERMIQQKASFDTLYPKVQSAILNLDLQLKAQSELNK